MALGGGLDRSWRQSNYVEPPARRDIDGWTMLLLAEIARSDHAISTQFDCPSVRAISYPQAL